MASINVGDVNLFFEIYGAKLAIVEEEVTVKPTLLVLHGGPGIVDHTLYVEFWSQFADIAQVVFVDQRGSGRSDHGDPQKWNLIQEGKDIYLFCQALNIENPIVAGVSWGGYVCMSYATQYPEHPGALIFCDTEARVSPEFREEAFKRTITQYFNESQQKAEQIAKYIWEFDHFAHDKVAENYVKYCIPYYSKNAYTPEELARCIKNPANANRISAEVNKFDFRQDLAKIKCPVLHLAGEYDAVHPVASAQETAQCIREDLVELVVIKNTADPVYRDQPEESAQVVRNFITKPVLEQLENIAEINKKLIE